MEPITRMPGSATITSLRGHGGRRARTLQVSERDSTRLSGPSVPVVVGPQGIFGEAEHDWSIGRGVDAGELTHSTAAYSPVWDSPRYLERSGLMLEA